MVRKVFAIGVIGAMIFLAGAVRYGFIYSRPLGICFGQCDQNRMDEFVDRVNVWLPAIARCDSPERQAKIFRDIAPSLSQSVDENNSRFAEFAMHEANGKLTVGERSEYMDSTARVTPHFSIWLDGLEDTDQNNQTDGSQATIRRCERDGFATQLGSFPISGYCEGFVEFTFVSDLLGRSSWDDYLKVGYEQMMKDGRLESYSEMIDSELEQQYDAWQAAEIEYNALPATEVDVDQSPLEKAMYTDSLACRILDEAK